MINHYNGLLCKLKDSEDLAEKMKLMSGFDDTKLKQFGLNGRIKMEAEYDESVVINKYLETLKGLKLAS